MLYYIGYYNCDKIREENRLTAAAAENKMGYVISALKNAYSDEIMVVSPAQTKLHRFVKGKKQRIGDRVVLKTFSSFSSNNKLIRIIGHLLTQFSFYFYLLKNIRKNDQVIVYHSMALINIVTLIKKLKGCNLVIEVEEIYADVTEDEKQRKKEIEYLQIADSYIFITELLRKEVNTQKPYAISHGTCKTVPDFGFRFDDGKIHVVYAGTFRQAKGGVYTALPVAEYLNENYVLEILGTGSDEEIEAVKQKISELSKKSKCKINYVGFKTGDDFNSYIQACHIGLSTQQPDGKYNASSFPSKILMYMSNGLKVVSVRIPAVDTSDVKDYIFYYDESNPEGVAQAVMRVSANCDYNPSQILAQLHEVFVGKLKTLLEDDEEKV